MGQLLMLMALTGGLGGGRGGGGNNLLGLMLAPNVWFMATLLGKRMSTKEAILSAMGMKQIAMLNIIAKPPPRRRRFRSYRRRYRRRY